MLRCDAGHSEVVTASRAYICSFFFIIAGDTPSLCNNHNTQVTIQFHEHLVLLYATDTAIQLRGSGLSVHNSDQ